MLDSTLVKVKMSWYGFILSIKLVCICSEKFQLNGFISFCLIFVFFSFDFFEVLKVKGQNNTVRPSLGIGSIIQMEKGKF